MRKRSLFVAIGLLLIFACLIIFCKIKVIKYNDDTYIKWSDKQVNEKVEDLLSDEKLELISSEDGKSSEVPISDLGINFKLLDSNGQEIEKFPRIFDLDEVLSYYIEDEGIFKSYFKEMNKNLSKSENAYYEKTDSDIVLHKEVLGSKVNVSKLYDTYSSEINNGDLKIDLNDFIIEPDVVEADFKESEEYLDKLRLWGIKYTNDFELNFDDLINFISVNKTDIKIKRKKFSEYLAIYLPTKLDTYNTVGKTRSFKTHSGNKIKLSSGTYGDVVDFESEVTYIMDSLKKVKSESSRKPSLLLDLPNKIPNTYIEVSIANQHLWYYVNGKLKMESSVVTGTRGVHDTPRGIYYISEKIPGKYLTGDTYRTWVNRWMRLTNMGVGLHDAYWRSAFGGSIYTYSGSHGCINLPKDFAVRLYDSVDWKTAVIIY